MQYTMSPRRMYDEMRTLPQFTDDNRANAFRGYLSKMRQIKRLFDVKKYRIVFIGETGRGKTTAICNWLNLLFEEKISAPGIDAIQLLGTAESRTTVAELHIRQVTGSSKIRIEYLPESVQKEYIKEFCRYYYEKCFEMMSNPDAVYEGANEHTEIDRVIRNMARIPRIPHGMSENSLKIFQSIISYLSNFRTWQDFYKDILVKIDLPSRKCTEIPYDSNAGFENWLDKYMKAVNDGRCKPCGIPKTVYLDVSCEDRKLNFPDCVGEVIDTVGVDFGFEERLKELMTARDTVCFIMDDLESLPSVSVRSIINRVFLTSWEEYCVRKTSIFVRAKARDLAAVDEAEGDVYLGQDIKFAELKRRIRVENIRYDPLNTVFADPLNAYTMDEKKLIRLDQKTNLPVINEKTGRQSVYFKRQLSGYDEELAYDYKDTVNSRIESIIANYRKWLMDEASVCFGGAMRLHSFERLSMSNPEKLDALANLLRQNRDSIIPVFSGEEVCEAIIDNTITNTHPGTLRKMNALYGGYEKWHIDIYTQITQAGKEIYALYAGGMCNKIKQILQNDEEFSDIVDGCMKQMDKWCFDRTDEMGQIFFDWAYNHKFSPQSEELEFWDKVNSIAEDDYKEQTAKCFREYISADTAGLAAKMSQSAAELFDDTVKLL